MYADGVTGFGVNRAAKVLAEHNNQSVFYYRFNFKGKYSHFYVPGTNNTVPYGKYYFKNAHKLIYLHPI